MWTSALDKYMTRVQGARGTGAGLLASVLEYNAMCVTTLNYIAQFCATTPQVLTTEAKMLQRLTGSPRFTFSTPALWSLNSFGMTSSFKSAQVCNTAAMVRMVLPTATTFHQMQVYFDSALKDDNAMMSGLVSREIETFDTPAIVNTLQKAIDHAFLPDIHHSAWRQFLRTSLQQPQTPELQKIVARYLVDVSLTFNASEFLTRRMARWRHAVSSEVKDWWDFCGAFATQLCNYASAN